MSGREPDPGAFLAQHSDGRVIGQLSALLGAAATEAEAEFQRRLLATGYSGSYLALLGLAATLSFDAGGSFPAADADTDTDTDTDTERRDLGEWHGYHRGLRTALACLVMHEIGANPRQAALLVAEHTETLIRCRWSDRPAKGGG